MRRVTLEQAIVLSLQVAPAAVNARAGADNASASLLEARGAFLPSVTLNSSYTNSSNERFDQSTGQLVSESYSASANANYELFGWGRRFATNRAARARLDAALASERDQEFQVALVTTQAYFAVAAAEELTLVAEQRLERARGQLEFAQVRLEVGTVTRSDVLRAELEVSNAELALEDARSALRTGGLRLGRQIGVAGEVEAFPDALPLEAPPVPELDFLIRQAQSGAPSVLSAQANARDRAAQTFSSWTQFGPTFRVTGGYDWFSFDFPPRDQSWNLRVTASVPLFNGFTREAGLARNRNLEEVAEAQSRDAIIGARVAVEDAYQEIASAERRVAIAVRGLGLAEEDLRVQEERYQLGVATILELQTSQVALADAQNAWVAERQNLGIAVARLEAVLGRSIEEINR
jgi:outer membrane protein TolC